MAAAVAGFRTRARQAGAFLMVMGLVAVLFSAFAPGASGDVTSEVVAGNPKCVDNPNNPNDDADALGYDFGVKIPDDFDKVADSGDGWNGTYVSKGAPATTITISDAEGDNDTDGFDWTSTQAFDAVIVKATSSGRVYTYSPPATSGTDLVTPEAGGGGLATISHLEFCWNTPDTTTTTVDDTTTTTVDHTTTTTVDDTTTTTVGNTTTTTTVGNTTTIRRVVIIIDTPMTTTTAPTTTQAPTTTAQVLGTSIVATTAAPAATVAATAPTVTTAAPVTSSAVLGVQLARTGDDTRSMVFVAGLALLLGGAAMAASDRLTTSRATK